MNSENSENSITSVVESNVERSPHLDEYRCDRDVSPIRESEDSVTKELRQCVPIQSLAIKVDNKSAPSMSTEHKSNRIELKSKIDRKLMENQSSSVSAEKSDSTSFGLDGQRPYETRSDAIKRRKIARENKEIQGFRKRRRYTLVEDYKMLDYIIKNNMIEKCRAPKTYDTMFRDSVLASDRTAQSMMSRMVEQVLFVGKLQDYREFGLKIEHEKMFSRFLTRRITRRSQN